MPDIFISYSHHDEQLSTFLYHHLKQEKLNVFLAPISIKPGERWGQEILNNLKNSSWIIFLASKNACVSPCVQQELGAALITNKKIVPIVWDMDPSELPGWINQFQAMDLRFVKTIDEVKEKISSIAQEIKANKQKGELIVGLAIAGLIFLAMKE